MFICSLLMMMLNIKNLALIILEDLSETPLPHLIGRVILLLIMMKFNSEHVYKQHLGIFCGLQYMLFYHPLFLSYRNHPCWD